ncbi:MAG: DNA polymerase III subunit gamma/tau [Anaerolineales bacterium]|nr:DNA polymerase III subunit gamma/tau [Anaerolineales bacterium]
MSQALYRKWRSNNWDEVVGQQHVVQTLRNAIAAQRVTHAYLFSGSRGIGKTTVARLLAKAVNCLNENLEERPCNQCEHCKAVGENRFLDLIEIDAASNTSVDDVRDLRDKINFSPSQGKYKIYIIDEVHMLSTAAFNALLKTLEEPPPHAIFVLATTEIHKIPATVLSRCQRHEFRRIPVDEIVTQLKKIADSEKINYDEAVLSLIARQATGSMRDAVALLDQLSSSGEKISLELAQTVLGTATSQTVLELVDAICDRKPGSGLEIIHKALDAGADPRSLARQIVDYLRSVLLFQMGNDEQVEATAETKQRMKGLVDVLEIADVLMMMRSFNNAAVDQRSGWQPSLSLELALAEVLEKIDNESTDVFSETKKKKARPSAAAVQSKPSKGETSKPAAQPDAQTEAKSSLKPIVSAGEVRKVWKQVQVAVKSESSTLSALLNSCRSIDVTGDTLVLGFASEVLREKMDKPDQIALAAKVLTDLLGVDLNIKCEVTGSKGKLPPDIDQNGMVAAAISQGGEIVDTDD